MAHNSPEYAPSEMSVRNTPLPSPGPATRRNRPIIPRNAVMSREHPPLYAGDYNNNLSKGMYWWEKLDVNDAEEKRILLAMYYGEERQPRCNVCEKRDRACMWFLGEEDQLNKSCVKCRRVHATCKPVGSIETSIDGSRPDAETLEDTYRQITSSQKRKANELDTGDKGKTLAKRTRSSLQANQTRDSTDDHAEMVYVRNQDDQYAKSFEPAPQNGFETSLNVGPGWVVSSLDPDDETQLNTAVNQSSTVERRDSRLSSITLGRDVHHPKERNGSGSHILEYRQRPQDDSSPGFSQIQQGLYALLDERYKSELEILRTTIKTQAADYRTQLTALRADLTNKDQKGEVADVHQIKKMETQIETERVNMRRLEDENRRLKNRLARLEGGQEAGMDDLQDQIKQLREEMNLR